LIAVFEKEGNNISVCDDNIAVFSAAEWNAYAKDTQENLLQYSLTYLAESEVNCPGLGTV
jgi:leucyl-tRNA synthetase